MKQSDIFLRGEGDKWHQRNASKQRPSPDPVTEVIESEGIKPKWILEIGCGDGWRLRLLREQFGAKCKGIDSSAVAVASDPECWQGTADHIEMFDNHVDMVIYGFCLYLVDREDLFRVAMEGDRVLRDGGHLVIHDFHSDRSYSRRYEHAEGVLSYKQDYARLWLGNPAYRILRRTVTGMAGEQPKDRDDQVSVTILKKDMANAWPVLNPINMAAAG